MVAKSCTTKRIVETLSGWWFGRFGLFFHSVGNVITPTDELIFSEGQVYHQPAINAGRTTVFNSCRISQPSIVAVRVHLVFLSLGFHPATIYLWSFPEMGVPPVIIQLLDRDFPWNKPTSYWGSPIYGNPHISMGDLQNPKIEVR